MRHINTVLLIIITSGFLYSQNPIIINDSLHGGYTIPINDTIFETWVNWPCSHSVNYYMDLDQDSINDINIRLNCYYGGPGNWYRMGFASLGNFQTLIDTNFLTTYQYWDSTGQLQDSIGKYTIPRKYLNGDTIFQNQVYRSGYNNIVDIEVGYDPITVQYRYVDDFIGDTCYIAFKKDDGNSSYLYYLKIFVIDNHTLELISAKTNDENLTAIESIEEQNNLFPNPITSWLNIEGDFKQIQIFSINGTLVYSKEILYNEKRINLSFLNNGLYISRLLSDTKVITKKIIKK